MNDKDLLRMRFMDALTSCSAEERVSANRMAADLCYPRLKKRMEQELQTGLAVSPAELMWGTISAEDCLDYLLKQFSYELNMLDISRMEQGKTLLYEGPYTKEAHLSFLYELDAAMQHEKNLEV